MRIFTGEFCKVFFKRGFLLAFLFAVILNGFLIYKNETYNSLSVPPQSYKRIYADLKGLSDQKRLEYLQNGINEFEVLEAIDNNRQSQAGSDAFSRQLLDQYKSDLPKYMAIYNKGGYLKYTRYIFSELSLYNKVFDEYNRVHGYGAYLKDISTEAENMRQISIFSNGSGFSYRNVQKTAEDMKPLEGRQLTFDISNGVNMATGFAGTDLLALLLIFYICMRLVMTEKEAGLFALLKPTFKGRGSLICAKLGVAALGCLLAEAALYAVSFAAAGYLYGFGDLSRPIQSVQGFNGSILQISVGQYFILYLAVKLAAYILASLVFMFICAAAKKTVTAYLASALTLGAELALYLALSPYSALGFFKSVNLINFLFTTPLLNEYLNVDMFSYPVNVIPLAVISAAVLIAAFFAASVLVFCRQKLPTGGGAASALLARLPKGGGSVRVSSHECFKLFVCNKAWLVLLALLLLQVYSYKSYSAYLSTDEYYYKIYMQRLSGPVTQEKETYLKAEQERFDRVQQTAAELFSQYNQGRINEQEYEAASSSVQEQMKPKNAFDQVMQRYNYIKDAEKTKGEKLWFVYDGGYNYIIGAYGSSADFANAIKLLLALIGCFAAVFTMETAGGAHSLITACYKGRGHTVRVKVCLCLLAALPAFFIAYAPDFINTLGFYGSGGLYAPAASLPGLSALPAAVSVLGYIIILFAIRLMASVVCVFIILFISQVTRSIMQAIPICLALLAGPLILSVMGVSFLDGFTLNAVFSGNMLFGESTAAAVLQCTLPVLLGTGALAAVHIRFCRVRLRRFLPLKPRRC